MILGDVRTDSVYYCGDREEGDGFNMRMWWSRSRENGGQGRAAKVGWDWLNDCRGQMNKVASPEMLECFSCRRWLNECRCRWELVGGWVEMMPRNARRASKRCDTRFTVAGSGWAGKGKGKGKGCITGKFGTPLLAHSTWHPVAP